MIENLEIHEQAQIYRAIATLEHKPEFVTFCNYLKSRQTELDAQLRNAGEDFRQVQGRAQQLDEVMKLIATARDEFHSLSRGMEDNSD